MGDSGRGGPDTSGNRTRRSFSESLAAGAGGASAQRSETNIQPH